MVHLNGQTLNELLQEIRYPERGIKTGFIDLDYRCGGMHKGDLYILGGRPVMGKTTLALNMVLNIVRDKKEKVLVYSLENTTKKLATRIFHINSGIEQWKINGGSFSEAEWNAFVFVTQGGGLGNIYIEDNCWNVEDLVESMKANVSINDINLVIVDDLHMLKSKKKFLDRQEEIAYICSTLRRVTKETGIPIIAITVVGRKVEYEKNHRPGLIDLKYGDSIIENADTIWLLYRDEYYDSDSERAGIAEVIIAKNKYGALGTIELKYNRERGWFRNDL